MSEVLTLPSRIDKSIAPKGLARVIKTMTWEDIEHVAHTLECIRSDLRSKSATRITGFHIDALADALMEQEP